MNPSVVLFFVFNVLATAFLGGKFASRRNDPVFRDFGIAMILNAIAFAIWSVGLISPAYLLPCVTLGTIIFLIALILLFFTAVQKSRSASTKWFLTVLAVVIALVVFYIGHLDPHSAFISPEGFLFFNLGGAIQMLYIFIMLLAVLPTVDLVASKFKSPYSSLFRYSLIAELCGGVILITSKDPQALYLSGWIIGLVYLVLLASFVFGRKAWEQ